MWVCGIENKENKYLKQKHSHPKQTAGFNCLCKQKAGLNCLLLRNTGSNCMCKQNDPNKTCKLSVSRENIFFT